MCIFVCWPVRGRGGYDYVHICGCLPKGEVSCQHAVAELVYASIFSMTGSEQPVVCPNILRKHLEDPCAMWPTTS